MSGRVTRRIGRLLDRAPIGGEQLRTLSQVVAGDLPRDEDLRDLLGKNGIEIDDLLDRSPSRVPRIRPVLVALAARSAAAGSGADGVVDREAQHAAELLHLALVVHDVTLGQRGGRRRRAARRILDHFGWIGANPLTLRALELARHTSSPEVLGEAVDALREIADAQAISQHLRDGAVPTRDDWRDHSDGHTGAVFSFCCRAGGHLGGGDAATLSALGRYGRHVGRLWVVGEDVGALERGEGGSQLVARASAGRPVLPVLVAAEADAAVSRAWLDLVADPTPDAAEELGRRVVALGGISRSREVMARESWAARRALKAVAPSEYRNQMERLAAGLVRPTAA